MKLYDFMKGGGILDGHVLLDTNEVVTQSYSYSHKAIDLVGAGNRALDVIAFDDGVVEISVNTATGNQKGSRGTASYGNFVKIRHSNGMKTLYAHLEYGSVSVKAGDYVSKGQVIGHMGDTGNAYGVHLHFEVRQSNEERLNPYSYLFGDDNWTISNVVDDFDGSLGDSEEESFVSGDTENEILNDSSILEDSDLNVNEFEVDSDLNDDNPDEISDSNLALSDDFFDMTDYKYGSIVDGLKSIGADSSFDSRTLIAYENGIYNYRGSYEQNVYLLNLLKQGKLKKAF